MTDGNKPKRISAKDVKRVFLLLTVFVALAGGLLLITRAGLLNNINDTYFSSLPQIKINTPAVNGTSVDTSVKGVGVWSEGMDDSFNLPAAKDSETWLSMQDEDVVRIGKLDSSNHSFITHKTIPSTAKQLQWYENRTAVYVEIAGETQQLVADGKAYSVIFRSSVGENIRSYYFDISNLEMYVLLSALDNSLVLKVVTSRNQVFDIWKGDEFTFSSLLYADGDNAILHDGVDCIDYDIKSKEFTTLKECLNVYPKDVELSKLFTNFTPISSADYQGTIYRVQKDKVSTVFTLPSGYLAKDPVTYGKNLIFQLYKQDAIGTNRVASHMGLVYYQPDSKLPVSYPQTYYTDINPKLSEVYQIPNGQQVREYFTNRNFLYLIMQNNTVESVVGIDLTKSNSSFNIDFESCWSGNCQFETLTPNLYLSRKP